MKLIIVGIGGIVRMFVYVLVLFDVDGCIVIVDFKKLCLDGKILVNG